MYHVEPPRPSSLNSLQALPIHTAEHCNMAPTLLLFCPSPTVLSPGAGYLQTAFQWVPVMGHTWLHSLWPCKHFFSSQISHSSWTAWLQWDLGGTAHGCLLWQRRLLLVASSSCDSYINGLVSATSPPRDNSQRMRSLAIYSLNALEVPYISISNHGGIRKKHSLIQIVCVGRKVSAQTALITAHRQSSSTDSSDHHKFRVDVIVSNITTVLPHPEAEPIQYSLSGWIRYLPLSDMQSEMSKNSFLQVTPKARQSPFRI